MALKLKIRSQFPAIVSASSPIILTKTGLSYAFSFDAATYEAALVNLFQPVDDTLLALAALDATAGLLAQTGSDTFAKRTLTGTANEIAVSNGDGAAGAPTVSLPAALTYTGKTVTGGTFTGGLWNKVTITAPASAAILTLIDGTTLTGPASSGTVMTLGNAETVTGAKSFNDSTVILKGSTSGTTTVKSGATAGSSVITLPVATDTLVGKATTDILTNKTFDSAGTGNVLKVSGITVSAGQYPGETTTGSATAGNVGEYVEGVVLTGSAVSLTSLTAKTVTSITLSAGDWDVDAVAYFNTGAATSVTLVASYISGVTDTANTTPGRQYQQVTAAYVPTAGLSLTAPIPPYRISISGSTTLYLVANSQFTVSTMAAFGIIRARRVR
jgi:hypothetical protein